MHLQYQEVARWSFCEMASGSGCVSAAGSRHRPPRWPSSAPGTLRERRETGRRSLACRSRATREPAKGPGLPLSSWVSALHGKGMVHRL